MDQRSDQQQPTRRASAGAIPRSVIALGFVSLSMDLSSELIHSLLPAFLVTVLGASALAVGLIEGVAESTVAMTKLFSGAISDWIGKRKSLVLFGYGLAALTKPLFPLATGVAWIVSARLLDRFGKGIRGAPRDALIADVTPPELRGAAFGLRQSMDTIGAVLGPALALLLMAVSGNNFRLVFWAAVLPAVAAVVLIVFFVHEPDIDRPAAQRRFPIRRAELSKLSVAFWWILAVATVLTLARFSEAFLLLAAEHVGMELGMIPAVLIAMNTVYALSAYPFGRLSDRFSQRWLFLLGAILLIVADLVLAAAMNVAWVLAGAVAWGLHMGVTQGLLVRLVVDATPADLRGTALGLFGLMTGVALLIASVLAGWLWTAWGPSATFVAGAAFALLAALGITLGAPLRTATSP